MSFLKSQKGTVEIVRHTLQKKMLENDVLHVVGHGHNFEGARLDGTLSGKPSVTANELANTVKNFISTSHRLIMLECCFAMGQYFQTTWNEGKGSHLGRILAAALGPTHPSIIIGGSANATLSPQQNVNPGIGYEIGTKFTNSARYSACSRILLRSWRWEKDSKWKKY